MEESLNETSPYPNPNKRKTNNKVDNFQIKINNEIRERDIDTRRQRFKIAHPQRWLLHAKHRFSPRKPS